MVTPNANSTTPIVLSVAGGSVHDLSNNALASTVSTSQAVNTVFDPQTNPQPQPDTTAPTLVITDSQSGVATGPVLYTLSFSEPVPPVELSTVSGSAGDSPGETITVRLQFDSPVYGLSNGDTSMFTVGGNHVSAVWGGAEGSATRTLSYTVAPGRHRQHAAAGGRHGAPAAVERCSAIDEPHAGGGQCGRHGGRDAGAEPGV